MVKQDDSTHFGYPKIIVPTNGIDLIFNRKVADIFQLSYQDPHDQALLMNVISGSYAQMGMVYTPSLLTYTRNIQGDASEGGHVPGLPQTDGMTYVRMTSAQWSEYVMQFRYTAMLFYQQVTKYAEYMSLKNQELLYSRYIPTGWVFLATPKRYDDVFITV